MLPDPKIIDAISQNDAALLSEMFTGLVSHDSFLFIRYDIKKDSLVLQSRSHRFLDKFCKEKRFDTVSVDETFHVISNCSRVLLETTVPPALVAPCDGCSKNKDDNAPARDSDDRLRNDWILLSLMLERFLSAESFLTISYKEAIDSLVITSRSRHFLNTFCTGRGFGKHQTGNGLAVSDPGTDTSKNSPEPRKKPAPTSVDPSGSAQTHPDKYVNALLNNDWTVLNDLYLRYSPLIIRMVALRKGSVSDAADVFQDALMYMYEKAKLGELRMNRGFESYFCTICRNKWADKRQRAKKTTLNEPETWTRIRFSEDPFQEAEHFENKQHLVALLKVNLNKLTRSCREQLVLWSEGKSSKQVAAILNLSDAFVRKNRCVLKKRLRIAMK